jgi:acetyl esterase/lipase
LGALNRFGPRDPAVRGPADVAYGPDPRQRFDLYAPRTRAARPWPLLVFFYGGAWNSGRRQDYEWVGQAQASRGFVVAVVDHRLVPEVRYPAFIEDGAGAVARARQLAAAHGGDPDRIVLSGHSSGAYVASMRALDARWLTVAGVAPGKVRAFAGLSGPYDFYPFDVPASVEAFGQAPDPRLTQPVNLDLSTAPPAFLAHGSKDETVAPRNSTALARALQAAAREVELKLYADLDHKDPVLALSRLFRGRAPVLDDMTRFLHARVS